jgi:hypothetical protein|tara:strand:+ start:118 stop:249 length:132 start_codon:yes stop_codon:yes gene_type:complete
MYVKSISRKHRQAINRFKNKIALDMLIKSESKKKERTKNERKN